MPVSNTFKNQHIINIDFKTAIDKVNLAKIALDNIENERLKNTRNWRGRFVKFIKTLTTSNKQNLPDSSSDLLKQYNQAKQALDQILDNSRSISFNELPRLNITPRHLQNNIMEISLEQMTSPRMRFADDKGHPGMAYIGYKDGYPAVYALFEKIKNDGWSVIPCTPPQKAQEPDPEKEPEYPPGFFDDLSVKSGTLVL